jgi:hypothetical protein
VGNWEHAHLFMDDSGVVVAESDLSSQEVVLTSGGGGSLPTGWTQDASDPANVNTHGGSLFARGAFAQIGVETEDETTGTHMGATTGIASVPDADNIAFRASGSAGATVALDAGGLTIINLPTVDPGIAGALWNNAGTPAISAG